MGWAISASEWMKALLQQSWTSPVALPVAFLLGLASAVASTCCTLPVLGAIAGCAGMRESSDRRSTILSACFFMVGTIVALFIFGSVAGLVGQVAQSALGQYWKAFAGTIAILAGLCALDLLPLRLHIAGSKISTPKTGLLGVAALGLVMGGAVSVCSLGCNPGMFIILGVAVLKGYTLWMFGILLSYAIGFSLPLALFMLGVSMGKSAIPFKKADSMIRLVAGVLLIGVGFYLFANI